MTSAHPSKPPPSSIRDQRWQFILAALVVAAVAVSALYSQLSPRKLPDTRVLLASMAGADAAIDAVLAQPIWGETRGHAEGALKSEARAVRLGAALAELELRHRRADSTALAFASQVVALLRTFPDSDDAVSAFQSLGMPLEDSALRSAAAKAERAAGTRAVRLGAWLRSARLATVARDSTAFRPRAVRSVSRAAITYDARPETEHAVRQFEEIARDRPHDWTALGTAVDELLRLLGTR